MHLFVQEMFMEYLSPSWYCVSLAVNYKGGSILAWEERQKKKKTKTQINNYVCMPAKSFQSCLTVCDHVDYSPLDSSVHGILKKESLSGLLCPPPGNLPNPGIEPVASLTSPALAGGFFTTSITCEAPSITIWYVK